MVLIKEKINQSTKFTKSEVPITTDWQNAKMIRNQSIRAVVREILNLSDSLDVVKINIIGTPSTGKTTLAETLAHLCHKMSKKIPYTVKLFTRNDLLNFEETLSKLQPTNHIIIFDDISFMSATAGKRQIDRIQKAFTEIRHLPGGQDVKIIAIFNFHYNMAVSKYMRQSEFFFYTSVGSSELENTQNIVGKRYTQKILDFRKINQQALTSRKFTFNLGKKGQKFTYEWRKPFTPLLFWNNNSARIVVSPKREWIDPICSICSNAKTTEIQTQGDINMFDQKLQDKYTRHTIIQAMKIKLFLLGVATYPKRVKNCIQDIEQALEQNVYNASDLALHFGLVDKRTRNDNPAIIPKFWTGIKKN